MSIQQEKELIQLLKSINNGSEQVKEQIECAELRLKDLEYALRQRRERLSFVRRIERDVGQEKLYQYFTSYGVAHLYPYFKDMTYHEFKRSDPVDWVPLSEAELKQLIYLL